MRKPNENSAAPKATERASKGDSNKVLSGNSRAAAIAAAFLMACTHEDQPCAAGTIEVADGYCVPANKSDAVPEPSCSKDEPKFIQVPIENQYMGDVEYPAGAGFAVADFDGDGIQDVFLPSPHKPGDDLSGSALYWGSGQGADYRLTRDDNALPAGLPDLYSTTAVDLDGDNLPELIAGGNIEDRNGVYAREDVGSTELMILTLKGSSFVDVSAEWGIAGNGTSISGITVADLFGDSKPDLFVSHYLWKGGVSNQALENKGGHFEDITTTLPYGLQGGVLFQTLAVNIGGTPTMILANDKDGSVVFEKSGGVWAGATEHGLAETNIPSMGLGLADFSIGEDLKPDGVPDVIYNGWGNGQQALMASYGDTWINHAQALGYNPNTEEGQLVGWSGFVYTDIKPMIVTSYGSHYPDGDYLHDDPNNPELIAREQPQSFMVYDEELGTFVEKADELGLEAFGVYHSAAEAVLDGGVRPALLRRNRLGGFEVFQPGCREGLGLVVSLSDETSQNPDGIGASVRAYDPEGGTLLATDWMTAGGEGYASSKPPHVVFAFPSTHLPDSGEVRLEIVWPDGGITEETVATGQAVDIERE